MKWISVDDRLPEEGKYIIVYGDGGLTVAVYSESYKSSMCCGFWDHLCTDIDGSPTDLSDVTYWMPLPEPPEDMK